MFKKVEKMLSCFLVIIFSVIMIPVNALAADETDNNGITSGKTYVITSKNSGKAMEVANLGTNNGDKIQQWDYANSTSQQWIIKQVEGQYYEIISKNSGKVVDVKDLSTQNGAVIHQWDFVNGDNQLWYFEKTDDGYFKIKSKQSNKCIDISGISKDNGAAMQLWDDVNGDNQKWKIEEIEDNDEDDEYFITSKNSNKVLDVENNSNQNGALIQQYDYNGKDNQIWIIKYVDDKYFKIINKVSGKVLDIKDLAQYNGAIVQLWDDVDGDNQLWYFEKTNDGYYKIKSKRSNKCLDVAGISKDNGAKMQLWDDVNGDNQKWKINKTNQKISGYKLNIEIKPEDDTDGDGIINKDEEKYGTDISSVDTDEDSLTDYEEIFIFKTNPLNKDSDNDGIDDGTEVRLNLDPLIPNEKQSVYSLDVKDEDLGVSMKVQGTAEAVSSSYICKTDNDYYDNIPGKVGNVLDFHSDDKIEDAEVSIKYDANEVKEKQLSEDNLSIYYINENNLTLEKIDSKVDKETKTVIAHLNHFSSYLIADSSKIISNLNDIDIVFAIDKSGSMSNNDPDSKRIKVCKDFVNKINGDNYRYGVVSFNSSATPTKFNNDPITYLTSNTNLVQSSLDNLEGIASGGTDIAKALKEASNLFDRDSRKVIILLTDGNGSGYISNAMKNVKEKNIQVYTVGLGNDVNVDLLQNQIAFPSLGQYYHVNEAENLLNAFTEIGSNIKIPKKSTITLRKGENEDDNNEKVDVRLIADSGFRAYNDGYSFENFCSNYGESGQCFGFSVTSILNYLGKLPLNSKQLNSKVNFDYDLSGVSAFTSHDNSFYNATKIPTDIPGKLDYVDCSKDCQAITINTDRIASKKLDENNYKDTMETLRAIIWWQSIQDSDLNPNLLTGFYSFMTKLHSPGRGGIDELKNKINSNPIEVNFSKFNIKKLSTEDAHSVVGETLYQDVDDSSIYYLGIYDSNHPENEEYIQIKKKYYFYDNMYKLEFKQERIGYQSSTLFYTTDIDGILKSFKK